MSKILSVIVAFVVLVDMVTGQGPPILNSYVVGSPQQPPPPIGYVPQPGGGAYQAGPIGVGGPIGYGPRGEYDAVPVSETEYDRARQKFNENEQKDIGKLDAGKDYKQGDGYGDDKTTPAPGMMSSISNAWKSISSFGRQTRSTKGEAESKKGSAPATSARSFSSGSGSSLAPGVDDWSAQKNRGYIYVKLPKLAVCYS